MSFALFEHEVKDLLREKGVAAPRGALATSPAEAKRIAEGLGAAVMVKPQVLAGGRGKAGVIGRAATPQQAEAKAAELLGSTFAGCLIEKLLVEEEVDIQREIYLAAMVDLQRGCPVMLAGAQGGSSVEETATELPGAVHVESVDVFRGLGDYQVRNLLGDLGLPSSSLAAMGKIVFAIYDLLLEHGAQLVEINPLALTPHGDLLAIDGKMDIDPNAARLWKTVVLGRERFQNDLEFEAAQHGLTYVKLGGNIGVLCTGAGLTMSTLDSIHDYGGEAANFLEFGGATYESSSQALRIVLEDAQVRVVLINTFGLVARADVIADGLVKALTEIKPKVPVLAAIRGTGEEEAAAILRAAGLEPMRSMEDVVARAVEIAAAGH
jgi:succinyl-CoA synthetase beta subunit